MGPSNDVLYGPGCPVRGAIVWVSGPLTSIETLCCAVDLGSKWIADAAPDCNPTGQCHIKFFHMKNPSLRRRCAVCYELLLISLVLNLHKELHQLLAGLGFCHGKKLFFCQKSGKNGKNRGKTGKNSKK